MSAFPTSARWATTLAASLAVACASAAHAGAAADDSRSALAPADGAHVVQLWHAAARDAITRDKPNQQAALRVLAYLSLAQQQAAEALAAEPELAGAAAWSTLFDAVSLQTLAGLLPRQAANLQALADALAGTRPEATPDVARARTLGERAAQQMLERAAHDGFDAAGAGTPPSDPSAWHSLLQPPRPPHLPALGRMQTVFLPAGDAVRPPPPPTPGSAGFQAALAEVRQRATSGSATALARAQRWEMTRGALVAGFWDDAAAGLAARHGLSGRATSRVLALTLGATLDANIACHDAKYTYWTPRPSQLDAAIRPLVGLPNHPSYPSNHACDSGAAAAVLAGLFPARRAELEALADEASESRIDAGIHYRFDIEAGRAIGHAAAAAALRHEGRQLAQEQRQEQVR